MAMAVVYANFGGQIVHENRGGVERRYVADTLGSTIALTDSGTTITDTWDYWPYGEVMSRTGTNPTPFTFVGVLGYFNDLLDKLFYVRARHYQPNYGRWLTVDPLWPGKSAYGYARTSPATFGDPTGLQEGRPWLHWLPFHEHLPAPIQRGWPFVPILECPEKIAECYRCLKRLYDEYGRIYPGGRGLNNTLRHCVGSCAAKRICGGVCSKAVDLHELQSGGKDSQCDLWNNKMGFTVAPTETCYQGCKRLLDSSMLCPPLGGGGDVGGGRGGGGGLGGVGGGGGVPVPMPFGRIFWT